MRVAVAGAGFQGACIALELSRRGCCVDLFDKEPVPVSKAGFGNEGKIHLGLVYAKDRTHRSIDVMLRGAFCFADYLGRWIDFQAEDTGISTPFYYAVHRESQLQPEDISAHFRRVQSRYSQIRENTGLRYLFHDDPCIYRDVTGHQEAEGFDGGHLARVFATAEYAVDPERIAGKLRCRVADDPSVRFIGGTSVEAVRAAEGDKPVLEYSREGFHGSDPYDHIVNALWAGKLMLDRTVYGLPGRDWIFRNKLGVVVRTTEPVAPLPSMTIVLGSYGDIVNYRNGLYYLSWYPRCMVETSYLATINDWETQLEECDETRIISETMDAMADFCPGVRQLADTGDFRLKGGTIFAWGGSDIEDLHSELHSRYDIGIHTFGRYHSVNTGKYTMAPHYAVELADRIVGAPRGGGRRST
jgi:hypothetical protein